MLLFVILTLLGVVSTASAAAILPERQAPPDPSCPKSCLDIATLPACSPITRYLSFTIYTHTTTDHPETVTIAAIDPSSVAQQFSTQAGIDTTQWIQESQEAPVISSRTLLPGPPTFTHTAVAPAYEVTEAPDQSYYVPKPYVSGESVAVATLTVTVSPLPATKVHDQVNLTISTTAVHTATVTGYGIWNTSAAGNQTTFGGVGQTGASSGASNVLATVVTDALATVTANSNVVVTASVTSNGSYHGYGLPSVVTSAPSAKLVARQTCTWVTAERLGGWCNNWDGTTTVTYSTYDTTVYPSDHEPSSPSSEATPLPTVISPGLSNETQPPVECGEVGAFQIDFDDLPATNTPGPLIFNPFVHFWWGDCWTYAPPPVGRYPPQGGPYLAKCIPENNNTIKGSPNAGLLPGNGFGAGPRESNNAYWFDAHSGYVACDDAGASLNETCQFSYTGWQWNGATEVILSTETLNIPVCPAGGNCQLHEFPFPQSYRGLTSMNFSASICGETRAFYVDTLRLDWTNDTCEAGLTRISSRKLRLV